MNFEFINKATGGLFRMVVESDALKGAGILSPEKSTINTFVINRTPDAQQVRIDEMAYTMPGYSLLPLVANQHFEFERPQQMIAWQFNREFYCIVDHDAEVGCVGFLFYGIHHPLFILLGEEDLRNISIIEQLCIADMQQRDRMQGEMLRTLLKRLIINSTRMAKIQTNSNELLTDEKLDIIRQFNLLLEMHFKEAHEVSYYAAVLNKSPKTLTNLFHLAGYPAPSSLIHKRIILEAKRYLFYTNKSGKEIGYELGFESPAHFSRFFKLKTGNNLSEFRKTMLLIDSGTNPD
ncbi:helix-turn-helix domain-containing protein [Arachidicoccus ginsenosidivorans]